MYYMPYNQQMNVDRINRQIEDLQNLKSQMQSAPQVSQAPINNYITTNAPKIEMEARMLNGESVNNVIIQNRTLFIDEKNSKIYLKELDGTISKEYDILVPKTPEQIENEQLKLKLKEMEARIHELSKLNEHGEPISQDRQPANSNVGNAKPATKRVAE